MIRRLLAAACLMLLVGCASTQKVETIQVKVKEPCIDRTPKRPIYRTGKGVYPVGKDGKPDDAAAAQILADDFERAEQYGAQWEAAAAGCLVIKAN